MTRSLNCIILVGIVTSRAGVGRVAICSTGRSSYNGSVLMTQCCNRFGVRVRASGAGVGLNAGLVASRLGGDRRGVAMTAAGEFFDIVITAGLTSLSLIADSGAVACN